MQTDIVQLLTNMKLNIAAVEQASAALRYWMKSKPIASICWS